MSARLSAEGLLERTTATATGCREWTGKRHHTGYGMAKVNGRRLSVHRLMWSALRGPIADGMRVLHHCDNRPCIEPTHLFLGTDRDNVRDMYAKGRGRPRGSAELSSTDLAPFTGMRHWKAAKELGVSEETVREYRRRYRQAAA